MSEHIRGPGRPRLSGRLEQKAEDSPTLGKILRGQTSMVPLESGDDYDYREGQLGRWRTYEVTIPEGRLDGSDWETYLRVWERLPLPTMPYQQPAAPQVTILTGEGQIPFSDDPEVTAAIVDEMYRQGEHETLDS